MRAIASLIVMTALVAALAGCADPSRESEAETLRGDLAGLAGVDSVRLEYTVPVVLDSGKLALEVEMSADAETEQVVAVVEAAYDAFRTTHHGEEADVTVAVGRTTVALRAFEPDATLVAVTAATSTGLTAAPPGGAVAIDLTTQDVPQGDHVSGTYVVGLPTGSTARDVPALLRSLAVEHEEDPLIGWGGSAGDGSSLSYDVGFPPERLVARWTRVQSVGLPLTVRAFADGALFAEGRLPSTYDVANRADRRALDKITRPQLRALGDGEWVYDLVGTKGRYVVSIDRYFCEPTSENRYDAALEAWVLEELGSCTSP